MTFENNHCDSRDEATSDCGLDAETTGASSDTQPVPDPASGEEQASGEGGDFTETEKPQTQDAEEGDRRDGEEGASEASEINENLATLKAENAKLADELAHARADLYNLRQEYQGYVRRTKGEFKQHQENGQRKVLTDLLDALDAIHAADQAGELEGPFAAIASKLENTLSTNYGLERFGTAGDEFDPTKHEALLANESEEVTKPEVATVLQPGYQLRGEVLRAARVIVNNPS